MPDSVLIEAKLPNKEAPEPSALRTNDFLIFDFTEDEYV